ncbi:MAG: alpha/beta fold hydrolase [Saprospiraceae bacterium]
MKKQLVKLASNLFPKAMANLAYQTLTSPQVKKLRAHELVLLDKAKKEKIDFKGFAIQTYKWGNPQDEKIFLIHGWEGQAGNFADLIKVLIEQKFFVISFDGPSHGFSSKGKTSLFEFSELVGFLIEKYSPKKLISHSFGGVATTTALFQNKSLAIEKYALLTTPDKFSERIDDVAKQVGVTEKVKNLLIQRLEKEMDIDVKTVSVSSFVKEINVKKTMIIHDKNDRVIPISQSKNVCDNWENCILKEIEGTGHFRILRTESVINDVVDFMS